jgi:hypothetical protein
VAAEACRLARIDGQPGGARPDSWVTVDEPDADLAVEMLLRGLAERPTEDQLEPYRDLAVRRLGRWPLLIDLAAAELRLKTLSGATPQQALEFVNRGLDEERLTAFEPADDSAETARRRERSAALTINASLKRLGDGERRAYEALAIFPEDPPVPCTTLRALWGLSQFKAEQLAESLGRRSLLKYHPANPSVRLHDVFRSYLLRQAPNARALHARLVDGWGDLYKLPDDYAWRHVAHHLVEAGRKERLRELLLDYRWLRQKLLATDAISLRDDAARFSADPDMKYLMRALSQSAYKLRRDKSSLRGQLYGRLMGIEHEGIKRLMEQIADASEEGPWLRPLRPTLTVADNPLVRVLVGHASSVESLAITPDGRTVVSGSSDNTVRVWDLASG